MFDMTHCFPKGKDCEEQQREHYSCQKFGFDSPIFNLLYNITIYKRQIKEIFKEGETLNYFYIEYGYLYFLRS